MEGVFHVLFIHSKRSLEDFELLQDLQAQTRFSPISKPPFFLGIKWSAAKSLIEPQKLHSLEAIIQNYMNKKNLDFSIRLDVAFVKNNDILEVFENVTSS